jgi:hypothetical protein
MAKTCAPLVSGGPCIDRRIGAYAQTPSLSRPADDHSERSDGRPVSGSSDSGRYAYGTVGPGAAIRRSDAVQPKASMVQQAAVGAASVIEDLPQSRRRTRHTTLAQWQARRVRATIDSVRQCGRRYLTP